MGNTYYYIIEASFVNLLNKNRTTLKRKNKVSNKNKCSQNQSKTEKIGVAIAKEPILSPHLY